MRAPTAARALAWFTIAMVAIDVVIGAQAIRLTSETAVAVHGFPFIDGAVVGSALVGALIVSRYPRHPIGWLLSVIGAIGSVSLVAEAYAYWVQEDDGPGSASLGGVSAWIAALCGGQLIIGGLALMFLLAPDGHLLSRRWRWAAWLAGLGSLANTVAVLTIPPTSFRLYMSEADIGLAHRIGLSIGFVAVIVALLTAVVSMFVRLHRSRGEQRRQLRPVVLAAALPTFGVIWLVVVQSFNGGEQTWTASMPLFVAYFLMPILFAIAALRHQLYELDVIINRTAVVIAGVAFAAIGYTVVVVTLGRVVEGTGRGFWLSLLGTAVVALAFQPLRRLVVGLANRLAYGQRAQPYEALADFSRRLADAPPPGTLLPAVAETAARAVSAPGAVAWLDVPGGEPLHGTWGESAASFGHTVPVRLDDRVLGTIGVALPRGRVLDEPDRRLLEAVAEQAAVAFRNTVLASQLAAHVDELERTTRQIAESRLRLVEADDAARRGLEAAIGRDVLPAIAELPARIRRVRTAVAAGEPATGIDPLVTDANTALEALRDLSRGVFPSQLERAGLEPALRSLLTRTAAGTTLTVDGVAGTRFAARVEAALYFCCVEATRSGGDVTALRLEVADARVHLRIERVDARALDLRAITDRLGAAGGTVAVDGDTLVVSVPAAPAVAASSPIGEAVAGGTPRG
ncbi:MULTISPECIES: GAF domain-containing protein [unclassified Nocardioides]|uniref:GAF domain-containing protein n=1 Tax=unclassified Nocardioides TaxID=2615069 RepID=UPI00361147E6